MDYYYTDANDTQRQLITIYPEKSDVYREDRQQQKFMNALASNIAGQPSEFSRLLSQLTAGTARLIAKQKEAINSFDDNLHFSANIHAAVRELEYAFTHLNRELITGLLGNGRPDKNNCEANRKVVNELLANAVACLKLPAFAHLTVTHTDRRFFEKLFAMQAEATSVTKNSPTQDVIPTRAEMRQYISDTGLGRYFDGECVSGHPEPDKPHLTIRLSGAHAPRSLGQLWAYNDLCDGLDEIYTHATELLHARPANFCQLAAAELVNFPKIIPAKCKLLIKDKIHSISGTNKLDTEDFTTLLKAKYKALKITPAGRNSPATSVTIMVNDPALIKIVDSKEAQADQQRG